jgi:hypothetical protein
VGASRLARAIPQHPCNIPDGRRSSCYDRSHLTRCRKPTA